MRPTREADPIDEVALFVPPEEWIDAFEAQVTSALIRKARRYAMWQAKLTGKAGGRVDEFYAFELVQDALDDTFTGVLAWDPERASLEAHIIQAIHSRSRHDREHITKFRHRDIDSSDPGTMAEAEETLARREDEREDHAEFASAVVGELRALASDNREVLRVLDAFGQGLLDRQDIIEATNMTAKAYRNARIRLARLVRRLSAETRQAARARA